MQRREFLTDLPATLAITALPAPVIATFESAAEPDPLLSLPFVREATRAERHAGMAPRTFWSVQPSGDYEKDCGTGGLYGKLALDHMIQPNAAPLLKWAVIDMMRLGRDLTGIEVGFLTVFERQAKMAHMLTQHLKA